MRDPGECPSVIEVGEPTRETEVLLIHAPYPGTLRFAGVPGSLLAAAAPYVTDVAKAGKISTVGLLDPGESSPAFYAELEALLGAQKVRAVCISTSTAAIEEAAKIAETAQRVSPRTLVVLGGPHEDGCPGGARSLPGVHLSLSGECGEALRVVLREFVARDDLPEVFLERAARRWSWQTQGVRAESLYWGEPIGRCFGSGPPTPIGQIPLVRPLRRVRFPVFGNEVTIPLMVSRGCTFGRCTFCSEGADGKAVVASEFSWVSALAESQPGAALYFQDSIFPTTKGVRQGLLPMLRELGRPWGCQVFLPSLSRDIVSELRASGCTYVYTGIESGAPSILSAIGKQSLRRNLVLQRIAWMKDAGLKVGLSLMFGVMSTSGELIETLDTLRETESLTQAILYTGIEIAGFYPNIQTVLPGTALAHGLEAAGHSLAFYRMPRSSVFSSMEDGELGYNFLSLSPRSELGHREALALAILECVHHLEANTRAASKMEDSSVSRQNGTSQLDQLRAFDENAFGFPSTPSVGPPHC